MSGCKKCMKSNCCSQGGEGGGCVDYVPPTKANHIRAMTDEELAEKIKCPYPWEACIHLNEDYPCSKCKLDWLRHEVET